MTVISKKDLRASFGPARDQDPRPTCMAFAASDAHAAARAGWYALSTEWAYYHALKRDGGAPHEGTTMSSMLDAIRIDGQPEEGVWPYIQDLFTDLSAWVPPLPEALFRRASATQLATVDGITARLDSDEPVLFTMSISKSFYKPDVDGAVTASEPLEPKRIHALVAVGHGHRAGQQLILVRNSWGEAWGLRGHAWLARDYLEPRLLRAATMREEV